MKVETDDCCEETEHGEEDEQREEQMINTSGEEQG
jgi:hypothetical protein